MKRPLLQQGHRGPDILAVRYVLVPEDRQQDIALIQTNSRWVFRESGEGVHVYENRFSLPRAWLVHRALVLTPEAVLAAVESSRLPDGAVWHPDEVALLEESVADRPFASLGTDSVARVEVAAPGHLRIRATAPSPGLLVVSEPAYPGWRATVDGRESPILSCDYVLMAVQVPAGTSVVELRFRPTRLFVGMALTAIGCLGVVALIAFEIRRAALARRAGTPGA
jgi:hypothetical protein